MSAVLESRADASVRSPIGEARASLEAARGELALLDSRIAAYQNELDEREVAQASYRAAVGGALSRGERVPKAPKLAASDAEMALPILRGQRVKLTERVSEAEGLLRRELVHEVQRRKSDALLHFAEVTTQQIAAWKNLLALQALLDEAGVRSEPLPSSLYGDFSIPAVGRLRPIAENHAAHFVAAHTLAPTGELLRMAHAARVAIEAEVGEKLPW